MLSNDSDNKTSGWSEQNHTYQIKANVATTPIVVVNGVVMKQALSASTTITNHLGNGGDYMYTKPGGLITFFKETVQNGDTIQYIYGNKGGSYIQSISIPATVSAIETETIFQKDGYYYVNLDKQSVGGVFATINGITLFNEKDYRKVSETRIQLLGSLGTYNTSDSIVLWYKTIYTVIGFTVNKSPEIPIAYYKDKTTLDEIVVRLFDSNGSIVRDYKITIGVDVIGNVSKSVTLKLPTFGTYSYDVLIKRHYPIINAKTVQSESQTERVTFKISRDTFYSPQRPY